MTSTNQTAALVEIFGAAFKTAPAPDLLNKLLQAQYKQFQIGEVVELKKIPNNICVLLLQGKLRVLHQNEVGINETILTLDSGGIFSTEKIKNVDSITARASTKSLLCFLDKQIVQEDSVLNNCFHHTSTELESKLEQLQKEPQEEATQAPEEPKTVIEQLFNHLNLPKPEKKAEEETEDTIQDIKKTEEELKSLGFQPERTLLSLKQLQQTEFPVVIEDKEGKLHLITGSTGDTLIEEGNKEFIPVSGADNEKYVTLKVETKGIFDSKFKPFSLEWYFHLFTKNWPLSLQILVAATFIQSFALGMPFFYMVIFDRVFGHQNLSTLDIISVGMVFLMVFDLIIKSLQSYILSHQLETIDLISSETIINKLTKIPLSKITGEKTRAFADAYSRLLSSNQLLSSTILLTTIEIIFSLFLVVILMCMNMTLTLISISPLIPTIAYSLWANPRIQKRALEYNKEQKECQTKLTEILENSETIKSINVGRFLQNNLNNKVKETFQKGFLSRYDSLSGSNVLTFISTLGSLVVLYYGAHEVIKGNLSYGIYLAINMLSKNVMGTFQKAFSTAIKLGEVSDNLSKIKELCKDDEDYNPISHKLSGIQLERVKGAIEIDNLNFRYSDDAPWVFQNLNLKIAPGEKIILTGKSGAGKTTLIRLLQRLYEPSSGYITLDKYNIADIHIENLRKHIGVSIQKPALFAGTIKENIAVAKPYASMQEITDAAALVELDKILLKTPKGFDTPVLPMGLNLSGGQAALIALARVLLTKPSILVIDETFSPLDTFLKTSIVSKIFENFKDITCIFVTDFISAHQKADRIVVLDKGSVVEIGSYEDLIASQGFYHHLINGGIK